MTTTSRLALLVLLASLILNLAFAHRKHQNVPPQDLNQTPPEDPNKMHPPDDPPPEEPKQKDPSPEEPAQKDQPPEDPKQKDPPPDDPKQKDPPSEDPKQSLPSIPKNHLPQNPKQNPPPTPENQKPQDPNPNPPQDKPPFHDRFKGHFSTVFAFGDSYTDTGNAQFMGSLTTSFSGSLSSPYGSTAFGKSSNRLSDGRLVIDYITDSLGLPVLPPYQSTTANFTNGANFAIAGATTLTGDLLSKMARSFLLKGTPLGVWTQMDWYKKFQTERFCKGLDQKTCADKLKTTLFWVGEIGINDYSRAVGSNIPLQSIAKSSVTYTTEIVRVCIKSIIHAKTEKEKENHRLSMRYIL
ncbi:hypothetical protein E3N88_37356 [Mikania micrantha]|uniref:SGNH hydrolase-type esterase domain-containing protein n=1 Tax=Mikania micrantha TaxID=192012 RepID=A0A5N6LQY7_9ASTR|nr:hypothetical protein E3N88_37356 [Mikania micrantha]